MSTEDFPKRVHDAIFTGLQESMDVAKTVDPERYRKLLRKAITDAEVDNIVLLNERMTTKHAAVSEALMQSGPTGRALAAIFTELNQDTKNTCPKS